MCTDSHVHRLSWLLVSHSFFLSGQYLCKFAALLRGFPSVQEVFQGVCNVGHLNFTSSDRKQEGLIDRTFGRLVQTCELAAEARALVSGDSVVGAVCLLRLSCDRNYTDIPANFASVVYHLLNVLLWIHL
jgi:hypothetical protein